MTGPMRDAGAAIPVNAARSTLIVDKEDYRQMLSQRGREGGAIDDW
jgi:hypothetical protein